jgi:hypothetical protein
MHMDGDNSMMVTPGSQIRRRRQRVGCIAVLGVVLGLVGCERAPQVTPAASDVRAQPATLASAETAPAVAPDNAAIAKPAPFELMGTSVTGTSSFAILKESGHRLFTVRAGDMIDGYTIASIESDRIKMTTPDNAEQLLVAANKSAPVSVRAPAGVVTAPAQPVSRLITEGVNTDQSIPADVTFGPTGYDPNNGRQMGH